MFNSFRVHNVPSVYIHRRHTNFDTWILESVFEFLDASFSYDDEWRGMEMESSSNGSVMAFTRQYNTSVNATNDVLVVRYDSSKSGFDEDAVLTSPVPYNGFASSIALSHDGQILVVGAPRDGDGDGPKGAHIPVHLLG